MMKWPKAKKGYTDHDQDLLLFRRLGILYLPIGVLTITMSVAKIVTHSPSVNLSFKAISAIISPVMTLSGKLQLSSYMITFFLYAFLKIRAEENIEQCQACHYPYDEESKPSRCPECGADLTKPGALGMGHPWRVRERRIAAAIFGALGLFWLVLFVLK